MVGSVLSGIKLNTAQSGAKTYSATMSTGATTDAVSYTVPANCYAQLIGFSYTMASSSANLTTRLVIDHGGTGTFVTNYTVSSSTSGAFDMLAYNGQNQIFLGPGDIIKIQVSNTTGAGQLCTGKMTILVFTGL